MANKPRYIIPKGDPRIAQWKKVYRKIPDNRIGDFIIHTDLRVKEKIWNIHEMLSVLQHYPSYISKFIFAVNFNFKKASDKESLLQREAITYKRSYERWFFYLGLFSFAIFFLQDSNARLFCLIGDWLSEKKVKWKTVKGKKQLTLSDEQRKIMTRRLCISSWMFCYFCHNTGFDPRRPIEGLIAEYDLPITYEDIQQRVEKEINNGVKIKFPWIENISEIVAGCEGYHRTP
jgi:hypothetical protein